MSDYGFHSRENALPFGRQAGAYAWHQLAQRAGVAQDSVSTGDADRFPITVHYAKPGEIQTGRPDIIIVPCAHHQWQALPTLPSDSLDWLPTRNTLPPGAALPHSDPIPVLLWGAGYEDRRMPFAEQRADNTVVFYADIVASTFFMLSRWEEIVLPQRDVHDRFPATASLAYRQNMLHRPVIDEYGLILRAWLMSLFPHWQPHNHQFSVRISHDIDSITRYPDLVAGLHMLGGDLLKRRDLKLAWQTVKAYPLERLFPDKAEDFKAITYLADLSAQAGLASAFFLKTSQAGPFDKPYDLNTPLMRQCIDDLRQAGAEIGFHPGYNTLNDPVLLIEEKTRFESVLGTGEYGGRQHYLRFQVPNTWRHWAQAGLAYDSTLGYADHEGFRCGTCHPYYPLDAQSGQEIPLLEIPLIAMDRTLKVYRGLTPDQAQQRILDLANRCQQVGGVFTLLWHNSSLHGEWADWAPMYGKVLETLGQWQKSTSST